MIVKDETAQVLSLLRQDATIFFDDIYLTVSDIEAYHIIENEVHAVMWKNVHVDCREWNDNFADARNHNFAKGDSKYQFWLDADDTFNFKAIPHLVKRMEEDELDAIFLPYNYAQDDRGNCIVRHWRERLLRRSSEFVWKGAVHETAISEKSLSTDKVDIEVVHHTDTDHNTSSAQRNHAILEKAYAETDDLRYVYYLGMSYFTFKDYEKAITILGEYIAGGGNNVEDLYRSMTLISEAAYHLKQYDLALEYATKAATLKPEYPMAYWLLAQYEADQENWKEALEWVKVSMTKPDPQSLTIWDPTARERAILIAAQADFMLNNHNQALAWLRKIPQNESAQDLMEHFKTEADLETFYKLIPRIRQFFKDDKALFGALDNEVKYDTRARDLRWAATVPTSWSEKSIVIFCGQGYEEWGPHTLDKGMGGSEEAVVYLSRELAKLGWNVTVYAEYEGVVEPDVPEGAVGWHKPVVWKHWKEIDVRDYFNVFVSWRAPQFLEKVNARVKLADIHDVLPEDIMKDYPDVTYLVKTAYHRSLAPKVPDDKFRIIGNGISKEQFRAKES